MRISSLFILLCCLSLSACVYHGDIHGNATPLTAERLSARHVYPSAQFKEAALDQLIQIALKDSPDIKIAETRVRTAQHLTEEASSTLWPSIDLSGYAQRQRFSQDGLVPPPFNGQTFNIQTLGLNFNYTFDFWGKNKEALLATLQQQRVAEAEFADARLMISAAVAHTYFALCSNIAQEKLAQKNLKLNEEILKISMDREKQGVDSALPVTTLQENLQAAKFAFEKYRQAELLSRHQLAVLIGENPFNTRIETQPFSFRYHAVSLPAALPAHLLAQRPDIAAAKARAEAAAHQINVAKARFFPDINLSALFSYQSVVGGLSQLLQAQNQNNAITGAIDLPIFDAGARRAALGTRYAEYDRAVNEYNQTILNALHEVADQFSILKTLKTQLAAQHFAVNAAQRNYTLHRLRYTDGISDYPQVLASKQNLIQQEATLIDLQVRHMQAVVAMLKALGGQDHIHERSTSTH